MAFDFDIGSLLGDIGDSIVDIGSDIISDVELSDLASIGTLGAGIYFQNEQLKLQEKAIADQAQRALDALKTTPQSLTIEDTAKVTIGEDAPLTEAEFAEGQEESKTDTGRITLNKPKDETKKKKLTSKLGSSTPQVGVIL